MSGKLTVGSLFSGIGGLELGLEMTDWFETRWQCEIDPYARKILKKHWPDVPCYEDVTKIDPTLLEKVDIITGGFPCQDISYAGKGAGLIEGKRSSLFFEIGRIVRVVRPKYILMENVPALVTRGLPNVLGEVAEWGYDAEWTIISAASVGALHPRNRIFIICKLADPMHSEQRIDTGTVQEAKRTVRGRATGDISPRCGEVLENTGLGRGGNLLNGSIGRLGERGTDPPFGTTDADTTLRSGTQLEIMAYPMCERIGEINDGVRQERALPFQGRGTQLRDGADASSEIFDEHRGKWIIGECRARNRTEKGIWAVEPNVGRVANGVPSRMDRLRCLGNAIVPQVGEAIGLMILEHEKQLNIDTPITVTR